MKKSLLFSLLFVSTSLLFNTTAQSVYNDTDINKYISNVPIPKVEENTYLGSPYENKDFQRGIITKNGIILSQNVALRYNANRDLFEIKKNAVLKDNQARLLKKTDEIELKINNQKYIFLPLNQDNIKAGYFVILHKGEKASIYKKIYMQFIPGQKAYSSMAQDVAPTYKEKTTLYISNKEGEFKELPSSKGGKQKAFTNHKKEVKQYIKDNKLNLNKETDLIKLVKYYNSL